MPRPASQARAARKLRRENDWIADSADAQALAVQLVKLAEIMDEGGGPSTVTMAGRVYLQTRDALLALKPEG